MDKTLHEAEAEAIGKNLAGKLKSLIASEFCKLSEVWAELWSEEERMERKRLLEESFMEFNANWMEDLYNKDVQMKDEFIVRIEELLEEIHKLEEELSIKIAYDDVQSLPLQCMAKELNQKAQKYRDMVDARVGKLRELRSMEASLIEALGAAQFDASMRAVPTEEQLQELQTHIHTLEDEKRDRMGIFMEKRQRIVELFSQLGTKPSLMFEKDVVMDFDQRASPFKVTNENMTQLSSLLGRLEQEALSAEERRAELVQLLLSLWEYLEQPTQETEAFLESHPGISQTDINALQAELERCKKEKSQNIGKFVKRIREAIVQQWDKCFVSDETRSELRVMRVTHFNEDVYDLHEIELKRWQNFFAENHRIFELNDKHIALFDKLVELNGRGKSANRYHNRGGQLLLEERQRKIVAKDLPRVEADLRAALKDYEQAHGKPFTHFGLPLVDVIDEKWRQNFDQKTIDKFRDGAAPSCSRTPLAVKRPAAATSASTGGKMSRMAVPTPTSATQPARSARRVLTIAKDKQQEPDSTINLEASYDDFQKTFKSKLGVSKLVSRSTEVLTPRKILRERTQPVMSSMSTQSSPVLGTAKTMTAITPKTVPRRGRPATQPKTPSRNRLPCIL